MSIDGVLLLYFMLIVMYHSTSYILAMITCRHVTEVLKYMKITPGITSYTPSPDHIFASVPKSISSISAFVRNFVCASARVE